MEGGWTFGILALLIVGAAPKILPMHHSDMLEISDEEDETLTEVVESDGFEIFGGFGYSNSLADFGVPVVYKEIVNLQVVKDNESEVDETAKVQYHDTEKENNIKKEITEKGEITTNDISEYKEQVKELEFKDEYLEPEESQTIHGEMSKVELASESDSLEESLHPKTEVDNEEPKASIEILKNEQSTEEIDIAENELEVKDEYLEPEESQTIHDEMSKVEFYSASGSLEESFHPKTEVDNEEPKASIEMQENEQSTEDVDIAENDDFELNTEEDKSDNHIQPAFTDASKEIDIDLRDASQKTEIESLDYEISSGSNLAVESLDVLMKEADEMETNEEVLLIHKEKEMYYSQSIASSKYFDATQLILCFAYVFVLH